MSNWSREIQLVDLTVKIRYEKNLSFRYLFVNTWPPNLDFSFSILIYMKAIAVKQPYEEKEG